MKKVIVKNTANVILQTAQFDSDSHMNEWIEMLASTSAWGKAEHQIEISPRIFNEDGTITEAVYQTVPAAYIIEIEDITAEVAALELKNTMLAKGAKARAICQDCLDIIAGFNIDRILTSAQVTQMQQTFGTIEAYLRANRPASAKPLIEALVPDEVLVTTEMKNVVLAVLAEV